ncbi:hypothetical protein [Sphingomonas sp. 35-24ZXX]|uniref:hypothetical protein n=1 Tax=Sphingomonas sp. 35-24ZXX TaxID=1545915 RepID=UPI000A74BE6B|nr:hypothetical protein [Sphingomonas sp. 35-24ZXX]
MTTAAKPKRRRSAQAKKPEPAPKQITIDMIDGATLEQARESLAKVIPGWEALVPSEQGELAQLLLDHRKARQPAKVKLAKKANGGLSIEIDGACETQGVMRIMRAFSANTMDPVNARASELLNYLESVGAATDARYNAALSFIDSMAPQNQMEALLLVEMYCTHDATLRALKMLGAAEWTPQLQTLGNLASKLLRASQGQMEALARMRRGGEQTIRHVHVDNRGGQAVIADTIQTGGANGKADEQSHATGRAGLSSAMLGVDPFGAGMPIASSEGAETVQDARGHQSGGT